MILDSSGEMQNIYESAERLTTEPDVIKNAALTKGRLGAGGPLLDVGQDSNQYLNRTGSNIMRIPERIMQGSASKINYLPAGA